MCCGVFRHFTKAAASGARAACGEAAAGQRTDGQVHKFGPKGQSKPQTKKQL